jgi:F0F1-type ATP synthase membrane subunit a
MSYLTPAQASAQLLSLIVFGAIARWYVVPWLDGRARADALIGLLWVQVFRYVALQVFSAQGSGFPISDDGAMEIVVGDVAGAVMAFVTIALLRSRARPAIPLAWLLVVETAYDTVTNIQGGVREHLMGAASGVTWMILVFFVPMVVVSAALLAWQLYARRGEALDSARNMINMHAPARAPVRA